MWVLLLAALVGPGRYAGTTADGGRVWLELRADGRGQWGETPGTWALAGETLTFNDRTWRVVPRAEGDPCLEDGQARICLRYAAAPERVQPAPARPEPYVGVWKHTASGGALTLFLTPPGGVMLIEAGPGGMPKQTMGRWQVEDDRWLVLTLGEGPPLRYHVKREGADLVLSGGDLPFPIRFRSG